MRSRWIVNMVALSAAAAAAGAAVPAQAAATADSSDSSETPVNTRALVKDATALVRKMRHDRKLARLLGRARGVLLVPHYGRGGIVIGGAGGEGLLLVRRGQDWYGPVFYSLGGMNVGIQLGAARGSLAMLLMNDKTVTSFEKHDSKWSMSTAAAFKVVRYGGEAQNAEAYGDVVLWSELKGLYGGVSVGTNNLSLDHDANARYYHGSLRPRQIVAGTAGLSHSQPLHAALAGTAPAAAAKPAEKPAEKPQDRKPQQKAAGKS